MTRLFLGLVGTQEILERVHIAAEDSSAELTAVEEAMEHLEAQYASAAVYRGETSSTVRSHDDAPGRAARPFGSLALHARADRLPADRADVRRPLAGRR